MLVSVCCILHFFQYDWMTLYSFWESEHRLSCLQCFSEHYWGLWGSWHQIFEFCLRCARKPSINYHSLLLKFISETVHLLEEEADHFQTLNVEAVFLIWSKTSPVQEVTNIYFKKKERIENSLVMVIGNGFLKCNLKSNLKIRKFVWIANWPTTNHQVKDWSSFWFYMSMRP